MSEPTPFDKDDPEFGNLVAGFIKHVRSYKLFGRHHSIIRIDRWANTLGLGRNDPCVCGSGLKFKKCCIDT